MSSLSISVAGVGRAPLQSRLAVPSAGAPRPPVWVGELVAAARERSRGGIQVCEGDRFALLSVAVCRANSMDGAGLERASEEAYDGLGRLLESLPARFPVRIWNFVPRILAAGGDGMDRYMRFNAGRFRAFERWFGGTSRFDGVLPAASAVGHEGEDLVVHVLASKDPGIPVDNPRQLPPHRYSKRFGPLPPCFARATRIGTNDGRNLLLVGGTSSVRGEDSVFVGDPLSQLRETLENLATLVCKGFPGSVSGDPLHHFRYLRIYYMSGCDSQPVRSRIGEAFGPSAVIEWVPAELCRGDLTVEIEGLAQEK